MLEETPEVGDCDGYRKDEADAVMRFLAILFLILGVSVGGCLILGIVLVVRYF